MEKAEKMKESWRERKTKIKHKWLAPFIFPEWLCERISYLLQRWAFLDILGHAGRLTILVAVIFYFAESDSRRKAKHYQAWQVINTAQGKPGSGGRMDALQDLHKDGISLVGVDISLAHLPKLNLENAYLIGANLSGASLPDANLTGAGLASVFLRDANLEDANLAGAKLTHADLVVADLRNTNLARANLTRADLRGANLTGADLRDANLARATLSDANLAGANLTGADLIDATLEGANLTGADLRDADLIRADLRGAELANIENWKSIHSIELANIYDVNAPDVFVKWATAPEQGAVHIKDLAEWRKWKRKKMEEKKQQEADNSRENQQKVR